MHNTIKYIFLVFSHKSWITNLQGVGLGSWLWGVVDDADVSHELADEIDNLWGWCVWLAVEIRRAQDNSTVGPYGDNAPICMQARDAELLSDVGTQCPWRNNRRL